MHCCVFMLAAAAVAGSVQAQCYRVGPPDAIPGVAGSSFFFINDADLWDSDGPGPNPPVLVVVGNFFRAGDVTAQDVATWDGQRWHSLGRLGSGGGNPLTIAASSSGELIAGGLSGMIPGSGLARWNGSAWEAIPTPGNVYDARFTVSGDLVIAGSFSSVGGVPAANVARRTAGVWGALGAGVGAHAETIAFTASGDIVVGGGFSTAGGAPAANIARWDGSAWSPLGPGFNGPVWALLTRPDGTLLAGGHFSASGGTTLANIAAWDGAAWSSLGGGIPIESGGVISLALDGDGGLLATGEFVNPGTRSSAMLWNGSAWNDIGRSFNASIYSLVPTGSGVFAVGDFNRAGGWPALGIARWSGGVWSPTSTNPYGHGLTALATINTTLIAAGTFSTQDAFDQYRLATREGDHWARLTPPLNGPVNALLAMPDGSVIAAGSFTHAGGVDAAHIARWDGTSWSALGAGLDDDARALALLPDGSLIAAGLFLHAGGAPANRIARWDGTSWHALGGGLTGLQALVVLPDGRVLVSKEQSAPGLTVWDGHSWTPMSGPGARGFSVDAVGDVYAWTPDGLSRLHAGEWLEVGHGMTFDTPWTVAFAPLPDAGVLAVGSFQTASGLTCRGIARAEGGTIANANAGTVSPYQPSDLAALGDGTFAMISSYGEFSILEPTADTVDRPVFVEEPAPLVTACPGASVTLSARATAGLPVQYAWFSAGSFGEAVRIGSGPSVTMTAPETARQRLEVWCVATTSDCSAVTETGTVQILALTPDVNRDDFVDFFDYIFFSDAFRLGRLPVADFNADGFIDFFDYLDFVDAFERGC